MNADGSSLRDIAFPATDAGVLTQVIALVVLAVIVLWVVRKVKDLVWFVAGLTVLLAGLIALRTVH